MQQKVKSSNKKQRKEVQILSEKERTKTSQNQSTSLPKSRAKFQCNPKLAELIELANIIPPDFHFDWNEELTKGDYQTALIGWLKVFPKLGKETVSRLLDAKIDGIKFPFFENFPNDDFTEHDFLRLAGITLIQYRKTFEIRSLLLNLIKLFSVSQEKSVAKFFNHKTIEATNLLEKMLEEGERISRLQQENKQIELSPELENTLLFDIASQGNNELFSNFADLTDIISKIQLQISKVDFSIDNDGKINFRLTKYADALQGVNISRLRLCEYCNRIFWANRNDAFTCSPKHARNRRMRLLRENWKQKGDLYLKARRKKANKKKENK
jgi:hypothetical protein